MKVERYDIRRVRGRHVLYMRAGGENARHLSSLHLSTEILFLIHDHYGPSCRSKAPRPFVNGPIGKSCEETITVLGNVGFLDGQLDAEVVGDLANITGGETCFVVLNVIEFIEGSYHQKDGCFRAVFLSVGLIEFGIFFIHCHGVWDCAKRRAMMDTCDGFKSFAESLGSPLWTARRVAPQSPKKQPNGPEEKAMKQTPAISR